MAQAIEINDFFEELIKILRATIETDIIRVGLLEIIFSNTSRKGGDKLSEILQTNSFLSVKEFTNIIQEATKQQIKSDDHIKKLRIIVKEIRQTRIALDELKLTE
jgi:hypothetical protein